MDRIDHVAIVVEDVPRAARWYASEFNCEIEWSDESWALLRFENCALALVTPGQHPNTSRCLLRKLSAMASRPPTGTARSVYREDPDGNVFEMLERPDA